MVKENRILPVDLGMAGFTLSAEHAFMRIVVGVAGIAVCQQFDLEDRLDVTIVAGNLAVAAEERVVGVDAVIEERFFPRCTGMAGVTLIATVLVVFIILEVAGDAGFVHFVVKRIL